MTELLYQTDSYLREFDAIVTAVDADARAIVLDRSAFYPGGGGQPNDVGQLTVIGGEVYPVGKVKNRAQMCCTFWVVICLCRKWAHKCMEKLIGSIATNSCAPIRRCTYCVGLSSAIMGR